MIRKGTSDLNSLYLGETQVQKVCVGNVQVYPVIPLTGTTIRCVYYYKYGTAETTEYQVLASPYDFSYSSITSMVVNGQSISPVSAVTVPTGYTVIEYTVNKTRVPERMFDSVHRLVDFQVGDGITGVNSSAFFNTGLNGKLVIDDSITYLGGYAFSITDYSSVSFGTGLTQINHYLFQECNNLHGEIVFPANITSIGEQAFFGSNSINTLVMEGVTQIGKWAFSSQNINVITITTPQWATLDSGGSFIDLPDDGIINVPSTITGTPWTEYPNEQFANKNWTINYI